MFWPLRYGIFEHQLHELIKHGIVDIVLNKRYATHYKPRTFWVATAAVKNMDAFIDGIPMMRGYLEQSTPLEAIPGGLRSYGPVQFELLTEEQMLLCEDKLEVLLSRITSAIRAALEVDLHHLPLPEMRRSDRTRVLIDELEPVHRASGTYINGGEVWS